jgi:hypothetical protein
MDNDYNKRHTLVFVLIVTIMIISLVSLIINLLLFKEKMKENLASI